MENIKMEIQARLGGIGKRENGCYLRLDFEKGFDEGILTLFPHIVLYYEDMIYRKVSRETIPYP